MPKKSAVNYEQAIEKLENIIEKLENSETSLEDAFKEFESGVEIVKECKTKLQNQRQKVEKIIAENGDTSVSDFLEELDE